jgi:hypothetical protein
MTNAKARIFARDPVLLGSFDLGLEKQFLRVLSENFFHDSTLNVAISICNERSLRQPLVAEVNFRGRLTEFYPLFPVAVFDFSWFSSPGF